MLEREFQSWILDVADRFGWRSWHVPAPMRAVGGGKFVPEPRAAGLPDLILMHDDPPRLIFAEVKVKAPLSPEQREFLRMAASVAALTKLTGWPDDPPLGTVVGAATWRPVQEAMIETVLRSKVVT